MDRTYSNLELHQNWGWYFTWAKLAGAKSPTLPAPLVLSFRHHSKRHFFCLVVYFKWKYFALINILTETICLFCSCVLFSIIYPKIKFAAKNWSNLSNFYCKMIFFKFLSKKILFTFLCWILLIEKISDYLNKRNLLIISLQITFPTDFCITYIHFNNGKKVKIFH